jgi:hypothetical protein
MKQAPNDKRQLPFGESTAIKDVEVQSAITKSLKSLDLERLEISEDFCKAYLTWIYNGSLNTIQGLEQFPFACYSNGTTEAFDKFYMKNHNRRFRCFRGEYVYHRLVWRNNWPDWVWLDDECLATNDAIVISLPFSDTGDKHRLHEPLLKRCSEMGIPVLVDCAYFGICADIDFNFNHKCITDITFSLSKVFPVSNIRIGMRLTREDDDDSLFVVNKINYTNRVGAHVGVALLAQFSADYIFNKYREKQIKLCTELEVDLSKTVLFGIGGDKWQEYNRGGVTNRLSFNKLL